MLVYARQESRLGCLLLSLTWYQLITKLEKIKYVYICNLLQQESIQGSTQKWDEGSQACVGQKLEGL